LACWCARCASIPTLRAGPLHAARTPTFGWKPKGNVNDVFACYRKNKLLAA
jgi:hypothetical protein